MTEGLEVTEVKYSATLASAETKRLDPEYFQKVHLQDEDRIRAHPESFESFASHGLNVDASAFYPSIEGYYGEGELPFLRVADVDAVIDFEQCTTVPSELCDLYPTLSRVHPGDIVLTKGGSVARVGLVTQTAAASRDLIFIDTSRLAEEEQVFLYLYFQTAFFNRLLTRSSSQTAQPHLTVTLVRNMPVFNGTASLKARCVSLVNESYRQRAIGIERYAFAEQVILTGLGLVGWVPPQPLVYTRGSSAVFASRRLDAEYFSPAYDALFDVIQTRGGMRLGDQLSEPIRRGVAPVYVDDGDLRVVNSQHVGRTELSLIANRTTSASLLSAGERSGLIGKGDVLLNSTGRNTIGRCQCVLPDIQAVADNHIAIIRPTSSLDPVYLACFLNALPGALQTERAYTGSSGQIELRPDLIEEYLIWDAPDEVQRQVNEAVMQSHTAHEVSRRYLAFARQALDVAIEQNEARALDYLDSIRA